MQTLRALVFLSALLLPALAGAQEQGPAPVKTVTLDGLLKRFAKIKGLKAKFREEKFMTLLIRPLVNEGTLHFAPPSLLARHTLEPTPSTVLVEKDRLRMGDAKHVETLNLKANPVLRQFVDSFLPILRGDKAGLEKMYKLEFKVRDAETEAWSLALSPKLSPMKDAIKRIDFRGLGLRMETMTIWELGGDRSVSTFSAVETDHAYSAAERAKVFRMPGDE